MRLVEDHGVGARKHFPEPPLLPPASGSEPLPQREVREEQVMVHHDEIGVRRPPPGRREMAPLGLAARRSVAHLAAGVHLSPDARVFGHADALGDVPRPGRLRERLHRGEVAGLPGELEERLGAEPLPAAQAEVVAAALQDGARKGVLEDVPHQGNVVFHQLLLEGARAGGDDGLPAGEDRGDEVRQRLSDPGGRLGDQHARRFERLRPRERHPELPRPRLEPRHRPRDRTPGGKRHPHFPGEISGHVLYGIGTGTKFPSSTCRRETFRRSSPAGVNWNVPVTPG